MGNDKMLRLFYGVVKRSRQILAPEFWRDIEVIPEGESTLRTSDPTNTLLRCISAQKLWENGGILSNKNG